MKLYRKACGGAGVFAAGLIVLASGVGVVRHGLAAPETSKAVTIDNYAFGPANLTVKRGTTVTWTNQDDDVHTVKSDSGPDAFNSSALDSGDRFSFTFDKAGTYQYICSIHPYMHGQIVVK